MGPRPAGPERTSQGKTGQEAGSELGNSTCKGPEAGRAWGVQVHRVCSIASESRDPASLLPAALTHGVHEVPAESP